jgi:hypothetical protein
VLAAASRCVCVCWLVGCRVCDSVMMACHDMYLQFNSCTEHAFLVFNDTRGVQVRAQPSSLFRLRQKKY